MPLTTKDSILRIDDQKVIEVFVKPWNDTVYVRTMSSSERDHFDAAMIADDDSDRVRRLENFRARLCAICLSDEKGKPIFTEKDARDLGKKCTEAMGIITAAAQELNGITAVDQEKLVKNSESTPNGDGDSDSASPSECLTPID